MSSGKQSLIKSLFDPHDPSAISQQQLVIRQYVKQLRNTFNNLKLSSPGKTPPHLKSIEKSLSQLENLQYIDYVYDYSPVYLKIHNIINN